MFSLAERCIHLSREVCLVWSRGVFSLVERCVQLGGGVFFQVAWQKGVFSLAERRV